MMQLLIKQAAEHIKQGHVIACPTETIYGFSCDPFNQAAVSRIIDIKQRHSKAGFIIVAADFEMCKPYIAKDFDFDHKLIAQHSQHPTTFIFPASSAAPKSCVSGENTIAMRVSPHPIIRALTQLLNAPVTSTSVNVTGTPSLIYYQEVKAAFEHQVDYIIPAIICIGQAPSSIINAVTGEKIR